jgi:hypothetical protein
MPASERRSTTPATRSRRPATSSPPSVVTLLALLGDEARGMRPHAQRDRDDVVAHRHLEVERHGEPPPQHLDVALLDVTAVPRAGGR